MFNTVNRGIAAVFVAGLFLGSAVQVRAQGSAWPTKPIEFINPFPAGGPTDDISRYFATKLAEALGQQVVVVNIGGAGGTLGAQRLARAPADGYTIGLAHSGILSISPYVYKKVGYDPVKDFAPIVRLTRSTNVLVVNPNTPYKTLDDLLRAARASPGSIDFGSAGNGSTNQLSAELLATMAGVRFTHIPYKGSAAALTDVIGGTLPFMFDSMNTAMPQIKAGKVRAIATTGTQREKALPDVPTVGETVPGYQVVGLSGILAPAGVPAPILDRLAKELGAICRSPDTAQRFAASGTDMLCEPSASFADTIRVDLVRWGPIVKAAGISLD